MKIEKMELHMVKRNKYIPETVTTVAQIKNGDTYEDGSVITVKNSDLLYENVEFIKLDEIKHLYLSTPICTVRVEIKSQKIDTFTGKADFIFEVYS